jgi:hypothetical protein
LAFFFFSLSSQCSFLKTLLLFLEVLKLFLACLLEGGPSLTLQLPAIARQLFYFAMAVVLLGQVAGQGLQASCNPPVKGKKMPVTVMALTILKLMQVAVAIVCQVIVMPSLALLILKVSQGLF